MMLFGGLFCLISAKMAKVKAEKAASVEVQQDEELQNICIQELG